MFYYIYVLRCFSVIRKKQIFYVGSTEDLIKRLASHRQKNTKATKSFDTIELVYYEACLSKTDALKRERQLKTGFGRGYLKRRIENYLKERQD